MNSPDIETFRNHLDNCIASVIKHKADSHAAIKIQSLLNLTIYVLASQFLEGSLKHILYNCCIMRGDTKDELVELMSKLKGFNNPEFPNIKNVFQEILDYDITEGLKSGYYTDTDVRNLQQIIQNRHRNVHASFDSQEWYNNNKKDIDDFTKEYPGLINVVNFLDKIKYNTATKCFEV